MHNLASNPEIKPRFSKLQERSDLSLSDLKYLSRTLERFSELPAWSVEVTIHESWVGRETSTNQILPEMPFSGVHL